MPLLDRAVKAPWDVAVPLGVVVVLTCAGCLVLVLVRSRWAGRGVGVLLLAAAAWWELSNVPVEGAVLASAGHGHGLHVADVITVQAAVLGLALVIGPRLSAAPPRHARA